MRQLLTRRCQLLGRARRGIDRPASWIDDNLDERCVRWAEERRAPTLLVPTDAAVGVSDEHVDELLAWADDLERGRARTGVLR